MDGAGGQGALAGHRSSPDDEIQIRIDRIIDRLNLTAKYCVQGFKFFGTEKRFFFLLGGRHAADNAADTGFGKKRGIGQALACCACPDPCA
jgi:hypothetical protein